MIETLGALNHILEEKMSLQDEEDRMFEELRARREERIRLAKLAAKKCGKCGKGMPEVEFSRHNFAKDGLQGWCKECLMVASQKGGRPKGMKVDSLAKLRHDFDMMGETILVMGELLKKLAGIDKSASA
jgi:hypothetical protein